MGRVFLIEDDLDTEALTVRTLNRAGISDICVARDGQEALLLLGNVTAVPELVLLDLKIPKFDGFQVLQRIRSLPDRDFPAVVVFSSDDSASAQQKAQKLGATEYAVKPTSFDELQGTIQRLVEKYLTQPRQTMPSAS